MNQNTATDYPLVQLKNSDSGQSLFLMPADFSSTSYTSVTFNNFPLGYAWVTVFVNGIPSVASPVLITGTPLPFSLMNPRLLPTGFQCSFTNTPGLTFSAFASSNLSLPLSSWTFVGSAAEISPGQFQFTDPQATSNSTRFYRLRSP